MHGQQNIKKSVEIGYVETSQTALIYQYSVVLVLYSVVSVGYISLASGTVTFMSLWLKQFLFHICLCFRHSRETQLHVALKQTSFFCYKERLIFNVI